MKTRDELAEAFVLVLLARPRNEQLASGIVADAFAYADLFVAEREKRAKQAQPAAEGESCLQECTDADHPYYAPPAPGAQDIEYLTDANEWAVWDGTVNAARAWVYRCNHPLEGHRAWELFSYATYTSRSHMSHTRPDCPDVMAAHRNLRGEGVGKDRHGGASNGQAHAIRPRPTPKTPEVATP